MSGIYVSRGRPKGRRQADDGLDALREDASVRLQLGSPVRCADGLSGELCAAVIDPTRRRITQLVVEPHHRHALARLVPVELVDVALYEEAAAGPALSLRCTIEELHRLTPVAESAYVGLTELPPDDPGSGVGAQDVLTLPDDGPATDPDWDDPHVLITYDSVPKGEIEIRRTSVVTAAEGNRLGHVAALVVDIDHQVREFVLERGLLWAKRELTIPIGAVARVETDSVTLKLPKAANRGA